MKKTMIAIGVAGLLAFAAVYPIMFAEDEKPAAPPVSDDMKSVGKSVDAFAVDMYRQVAKGDKNTFFSPYSIEAALAMTYMGARGNTAAEMKKTLKFELDDKAIHKAFAALAKYFGKDNKGLELSIANALWGQKGYPFLKEYLAAVKESYGAPLNEMDFKTAPDESRKQINKWVEDQTKNKIKDLLAKENVTEATRLVLTNAIYFKGTWETIFDKKFTKKKDFSVTASKKVQADMMHHYGESFKYLKGEGFAALEMPYKGDKFSMYVFLPDAAEGLADFENKATAEALAGWIDALAYEKIAVTAVPRFKMECSFQLADVLKVLGMKDAFVFGPADFTGMAGTRELYISAVVHKAFVEVNEEGTEAAAATAVSMEAGCAAPSKPPVYFECDHPFMFVIRDRESGTILFMGRVMDPTTKE
jgi:serpin B